MAFAVAMAACVPTTANAAEEMKGVQQLMQIKTKAAAEALKLGDSIAMVCAKCKSVMVHNVTTGKGHINRMTVGEKASLPGMQ
jgi:hypothetical protein